MQEYVLGMMSAVWLGILTSISPCPLATNIAAISYIGRRVDSARLVLLTGLLYTLGRTLAYVALGLVLVASLLSVPQVSLFLQKYMHVVLGPILIVVGMLLLGLIQLNFGSTTLSSRLQGRVDSWGIWGALVLGAAFALAFCPTSAALFFGSLIPLSLSLNSKCLLPALYGLGTALPVIVFAVLIATSAAQLGRAFNILSKVEWWARTTTGWLFILVGIFFSLRYVFEVL